MRKLRTAFRHLYRNPAFSGIAVVTLALALGASIALYAVVESVLLRPLPYRDADRLVAVWDVSESIGWEKARVTPSHYWIWKDQSDVFDQVAIYGSTTHTLRTDADPLQISGTRVSREYFPLLGMGGAMGRFFGEADFAGDAPAVAVISHALWRDVLAGDPDVIGRSVQLDGNFVTVVGVAPPDVLPIRAAASGRINFDTSRPHVWIPFPDVPNRRGSHVFGILARLAGGVTPPMARTRLDDLAPTIEATRGFKVAVIPLVDELVGDVRASLQMLMAAVFLVLVVAVLNVSNLVVVRASGRAREQAVRTALGASRGRLLGDNLVEGAVLTGIAGLAGLALGTLLLEALQARPPLVIPRLQDATVFGPFLRFGIPVMLATCVLFGLASLRSGGRELLPSLTGAARGSTAGSAGPRMRQFLVAAEMAVTVVLIIGSGLLLRSFYELTSVDPGFRNTQVLTLDFQHTDPRYQDMGALNSFYDNLFTQLGSQPGVLSVAASYDHPMTSNWGQGFRIVSGDNPEGGGVGLFRTVTPGFFNTLGIGLLEGRDFSDADTASAPGAVILNQAFRRRHFPEVPALGQELEIGTTQWMWGDAIPTRFRVVGVVEDVRFHGLDQASEPAFYLPYRQTPHQRMTVYARTATPPENLLPSVRRIVRGIDAELPIAGTSTMASILSNSVAQPRFNLMLVAGFGACALLLALVGLGGVLSFIVRQRLHEIGIRMALGARRQNVVSLLMKQGVAPALVGLLIGTAGAFFLSRFASSLLFEVSPNDPVTYAVAVSVLLVAAALACLGPAVRACRVDPLKVLRAD